MTTNRHPSPTALLDEDQRVLQPSPPRTDHPSGRIRRNLVPIIVSVVGALALLAVWTVFQSTGTVAGAESVFVDHDSGIEMQLREVESARAGEISSSYDAGIAAHVKQRHSRVDSAHDAGIAAQVKQHQNHVAGSAWSAYDSGIAAQLKLQSASDGPGCAGTAPGAGGWEVRAGPTC